MGLKHTPAPWIISDSGNEIMDSEQFIFADVRRHTILCRWYEKGFEHWNDAGASKDIGCETKAANAHLIAAAPELLEALIEMQRNGRKQGWNDSYESSMEKTSLAIAKALSQQ